MALTALVLAGIAATGGGSAALAMELTRHATSTEASAAAQQELATRWQRLPAGQIFPQALSYATTLGPTATASLVGIAPATTCAKGFDPAVARTLVQAGCVSVLRATYGDPSGTVFATMGIAVMRSPAAAQSAESVIQAGIQGGVQVASFPGTVTSQFTNAAREATGQQAADGRYLVFYSAGYGDGRHTSLNLNAGESAPFDLGTGLRYDLATTFSLPANPCTLKDIQC
jgi:hypothetical protein